MDVELTIQQAAEATDLSAHTLRYYERSGLIDTVPRSASGYRAYGPAHLAQIIALKRLRAVGMAIRDIETFMAHYRAQDYAACVDLLQAHQGQLNQQLSHTHDYLDQLDTKIQLFRARMEDQLTATEA